MIELYRNEPERIEKRFFRGGVVEDVQSLDFELVDAEGLVLVSGSATEAEPGVYNVDIPALNRDDALRINWTYVDSNGYMSEATESVVLVQPYARYEEIIRDHPQIATQYNYLQIKNMERRVRMVIDTFCGQSFTYEPNKTITVAGAIGNALPLPRRIIRLHHIWANFGEVTQFTQVSPGGTWMLRYAGPQGYIPYRDIKRDIGPGMGTEAMHSFFRGDTVYTINGDFGWEEVPSMVNQAARMLVWDYFQPEAEWRRKNVDNLRAADWRYEVATAPITTTGNIDADLMLSNYTAPSVAIL